MWLKLLKISIFNTTRRSNDLLPSCTTLYNPSQHIAIQCQHEAQCAYNSYILHQSTNLPKLFYNKWWTLLTRPTAFTHDPIAESNISKVSTHLPEHVNTPHHVIPQRTTAGESKKEFRQRSTLSLNLAIRYIGISTSHESSILRDHLSHPVTRFWRSIAHSARLALKRRGFQTHRGNFLILKSYSSSKFDFDPT